MSLVFSCVLGSLGIFFLIRGKKTMNSGMMIAGGILIVLSYLLPDFSSHKSRTPDVRKVLEIQTPTPVPTE